MAVDSAFSILNSYLKRFIRRHPMVFLGMFVAIFWLPLIFKIADGTWREPIVNIYIMQFEYANIPVGLTIMYLVFLPIYFFYIKPYDQALDEKIDKQTRKALEDAYGRQSKRLKDFWK